jgi:hypothetical protein
MSQKQGYSGLKLSNSTSPVRCHHSAIWLVLTTTLFGTRQQLFCLVCDKEQPFG